MAQHGSTHPQLILEEFAPEALVAGASASVREQTVANHKILQDDYKKYLAVQEVKKDIIEYAVGSSPIAALK